MHSRISEHQEHSAVDGESNSILPQSKDVESERAQNGRSGYFDVETVLLVHERQVANLVYDQAFESVMEDRELETVSEPLKVV